MLDTTLAVTGFTGDAMQRIATKHRDEWIARINVQIIITTQAWKDAGAIAYNALHDRIISYKKMLTLVTNAQIEVA